MKKEERQSYVYEGRPIYEWEESLDSITIFVNTPPLHPSVKLSNVFDVKITSSSVTIGIKGNPPYLSHQTEGVVDS